MDGCTEIHFHFSFSVVVLTLLSKPLSVTCKPIIIENNRKETVGWYVWYLKFINMCAMRKLIHFQFRTPQMTDLEINHYVLFSNINLWSLKKKTTIKQMGFYLLHNCNCYLYILYNIQNESVFPMCVLLVSISVAEQKMLLIS